MKTKTSSRLILYGAFLVACGLLGYLSNPEKAKTALMSGGTFGALSILWGMLLARGHHWSAKAALATTGLLAAVFAWRATVSWMAVGQGNQDKRFAAILISVMLAGSVLMLVALLRGPEAEARR